MRKKVLPGFETLKSKNGTGKKILRKSRFFDPRALWYFSCTRTYDFRTQKNPVTKPENPQF